MPHKDPMVAKAYFKEYAKRRPYRPTTPERRELSNAIHRRRYALGIDKNRDLLRRFGITFEEFQKLNQLQNGLCAICNQPEIKTYRGKLKSLSVDHNHTTGKIRELLCGNCNSAIGMLNEDLEILKKSIKYLEKHATERPQPQPTN